MKRLLSGNKFSTKTGRGGADNNATSPKTKTELGGHNNPVTPTTIKHTSGNSRGTPKVVKSIKGKF